MSVDESSAPESREITFVNRFSLRTTPAEFERAFTRTSEFMGRQPGFLRHTLLRHMDREDSYLNIAYWRDVESFRKAVTHPDFPPHAAALRAVCTSEPGLYAPRSTSTGSAHEHDGGARRTDAGQR